MTNPLHDLHDSRAAPSGDAPWWKHGHVWLVISGPAVVVVAALFTGWIAMRGADPVLEEDYYRRGLQLSRPAPGDKAHMPALQGRNHAATPAPGR